MSNIYFLPQNNAFPWKNEGICRPDWIFFMCTGFVVFHTFPGVNEVESLIMLISSVIKMRLSNNVHLYVTALLMEEL